MTVRECLSSMSPYPLPTDLVKSICETVGADIDGEVSDAGAKTVYRAKARVYLYLSTAPNVSEGGVSISFSAADKNCFLSMARRFARLAGETGLVPGAEYGYKGEML